MTGRMSNRDRIANLRAEADAAAKEKAAAKAAKAAAPAKPRKTAGKSAAGPTRGKVRIVWFVCDASGREVQRFPYPQEAEARAAAAQLTASSGRTHFVKQADVPAN
jgi:hypothetical protein